MARRDATIRYLRKKLHDCRVEVGDQIHQKWDAKRRVAKLMAPRPMCDARRDGTLIIIADGTTTYPAFWDATASPSNYRSDRGKTYNWILLDSSITSPSTRYCCLNELADEDATGWWPLPGKDGE